MLLQLAGFVVNLDTREQVQKLQREVRQCTDGLASLQHHLTTGFAEVKDKIAEVNDSQDRYIPFLMTQTNARLPAMHSSMAL